MQAVVLPGHSSNHTNPDSSCIDTGDTAFVLIASVFVLFMAPGLLLFEIGLLRRKNSLSILMQVLCGFAALATMWSLFGFSFVFGPSQGGFIGNPITYFALHAMDFHACHPRLAPNIPLAAVATFQMMFASITPLLMTGAYAERVRFRASLTLTILWEVLVYYPVAHWIWNPEGWMAKMGVLDFAGGIVIHCTAGAGALVTALFAGKRIDFEEHEGEPIPHDLATSAIGTGILFVGWFFFCSGSAMSAGSLATQAVYNTQAAAFTSALTALILSWALTRGRPSSVHVMNGLVGGLAGITPATGFIPPGYSMICGIVFGCICMFGPKVLKGMLHIDDALDVSSVHGMTGIAGALFIGVFATGDIDPRAPEKGLIKGHWRLLGVQVMAVVVTFAWTVVMTLILCVLIKYLVWPFGRGFRVPADKERLGLDVVEHDEELKYEDIEEGGLPITSTPHMGVSHSNPSVQEQPASRQLNPHNPRGALARKLARGNTFEKEAGTVSTPLLHSQPAGPVIHAVADDDH